MNSKARWTELAEPLRRRGLLIRAHGGPLYWYQDGGLLAHRGHLWFVFGHAEETRDLQCWVSDRGDASTTRFCTLANLLVTLGQGRMQSSIDHARRSGDASMMESYAEVIDSCFTDPENDLVKWRETLDFEDSLGAHVETMFEDK